MHVITHTCSGQPAVVVGDPDRPALASNVQLLGEMQGTGFTNRQWLVQRDGQFIQLTELLYRIAEQADGEHTLGDIAGRLTAITDWTVSADNVRHLMQTKLAPLGLIATADESPAYQRNGRAHSPLQVNLRTRILSPRILAPVTGALQIVYTMPAFTVVLLAAMIMYWWLYMVHGVQSSVYQLLYTPALLLGIIVIIILSDFFHEIGHATGLRRGNGHVRGIGIGFYLVYPTFYTDVTDAYRLGRWSRLRTDLGGIYFHLIFSLGIVGFYLVSGQEFVLAAVPLINLDMLYQFLPYVRLDGYWALADLTGVPDFFSQMGAFLRSILPIPAFRNNKLPPLRPWVRAVFAIYTMVTIPVLSLLFIIAIKNTPGFAGVARDSFTDLTQVLAQARADGDFLLMAGSVVQMLILAVPILGVAVFLHSLARKPVGALVNWSKPTPARRVTGALAATGVVGVVVLLSAAQLPFARASALPPTPPGVEGFEITERTHVQEPISYPQTPPVGGPHAPLWQNCGFYDTPVASEHAVHSMEHGAVWITYRLQLPAADVDILRRLPGGHSHVLVSPYPDLPAPVVASAWGRQLRLDSADDPRLEEFVGAFEKGPQTPERGAPCDGGIGTPAA